MSILFTNVTAVTMSPDQPVLSGVFVAVEGIKIASVGPEHPAGEFERVIDCTGKVMMPGLVNAHTHVPMALMRGYGGGCDLHTWLNDYIFPAEAKLDDRCVAAGAALGLAEMIASGTTCIADMYMNTGTIAKTVLEAGISANLACGAVYFGDPADFSPEKCGDCKNHVRLYEDWHNAGEGQLRVDASIHAEYTSCPPVWEWVAGFAREHGLRMHVHVSETASEHEKCLEKYGVTPAQILDRYGVWQNGGIAAHCVYLSGGDAELFAERGVTAVHNPVSNLKLMSGVAPLFFLRDCGMQTALGTDGVASNNSHDMFEEMKTAALVQNYSFGEDHGQLSAADILAMATVNGARALGRDTGVIAAGKIADMILLDFTAPNLFPCHDIMENLVYSANGSNVCMNMARGKIIYENGTFLTLDLEKIRAEVAGYALPRIFGGK
ncbi:MAG: amidohydrolase [Lawsonibacter sp.]|nr:amidohydrolase [Lawsonibacter sp.]